MNSIHLKHQTLAAQIASFPWWRRWDPRLKWKLLEEKRRIEGADEVLCPSRMLQNEVLEHFAIAAGKVKVVYPQVEVELYSESVAATGTFTCITSSRSESLEAALDRLPERPKLLYLDQGAQFSDCDCYISMRPYAACELECLQASALGLYVILSDHNGASELLPEGSYCESEDLVHALETALQHRKTPANAAEQRRALQTALV